MRARKVCPFFFLFFAEIALNNQSTQMKLRVLITADNEISSRVRFFVARVLSATDYSTFTSACGALLPQMKTTQKGWTIDAGALLLGNEGKCCLLIVGALCLRFKRHVSFRN
jgi:hypothetical protein